MNNKAELYTTLSTRKVQHLYAKSQRYHVAKENQPKQKFISFSHVNKIHI